MNMNKKIVFIAIAILFLTTFYIYQTTCIVNDSKNIRTNDTSSSEVSKLMQDRTVLDQTTARHKDPKDDSFLNAASETYKNNNVISKNNNSEETMELPAGYSSEKVAKEILKFKNITCEPVYPKVLLYNRIPKTGSSSITNYTLQMARQSKFAVHLETTEQWYNNHDKYLYSKLVESKSRKNESSAFIAHFYFRQYFDIDKSFTYINILRHPVSRIISHFYYMREETLRSKEKLEEFKKRGYWNESILNCIIDQHEGCEDNLMTRFLCGRNSYCKTGSEKALNRAKFNMDTYYTSIGIFENLPLTLRILEKRLPKFFTRTNKNATLNKVRVNTHKPRINDAAIKNFILKHNKADMELYNYALKRFNDEIRICLS